jgi:hypothetical protein
LVVIGAAAAAFYYFADICFVAEAGGEDAAGTPVLLGQRPTDFPMMSEGIYDSS